jgi:hypothetical protein
MSVSLLLDEVQRAGLAVSRNDSLEEFVNACSAMGEILSLQDVAIIAGSRKHVSSPGAIPLHSDGPAADVVAWYCVRQDDEDGTSLLLDTLPVLRSLTSRVREALGSIELPYFDSTSHGRPKGYAPLLRGHEETTWRVNYAPWLVPATLEDEQRAALDAFQEALTSGTPTKLRLAESQCLFIDNWRVLHGRASLLTESTRLLKRAWLRTSRQQPNQPRVRP